MLTTIPLVVLLALQQSQPPASTSGAREMSCAASYLGRMISDYGVPSSWKVSKVKYSKIEHLPQMLIRDYPEGMSDGYVHWLSLSEGGETAYVVQIGGIGGFRHVYGPFPAMKCRASNG